MMICVEMSHGYGKRLAASGAQLITTVSAWTGDHGWLFEEYAAQNALESGCWHVIANQGGTVGQTWDYGHSRIVAPDGTLVASTGKDEGMVVAKICLTREGKQLYTYRESEDATMERVTNAINWFEIPVRDFERAKVFYSAIFDYEMPVFPMGSVVMGILPYENNKSVGGAILQAEGHEPSVHGPRVYLNGGEDLNVVLGRVAAAGGTVLTEKTLVAEDIGYCAFFLDSEGNKLALHSPK